jgi:hypothetical protein
MPPDDETDRKIYRRLSSRPGLQRSVPNFTALKKSDFDFFHRVIQEHLFKNLRYESLPQSQIESVLTKCRHIEFRKTNNRRVLGSMNDQKLQLEYLILAEGCLARTNIYELNQALNRTNYSAINRRRPIEKLQEKLKEPA